MIKCRYKVGLLHLNDCGKTSEFTCTACSRPVCSIHARTAAEGPLCLECYVKKVDAKNFPAGDSELHSAGRRSRLYSGGYHPHYYGTSMMYGDEDYDTFEEMGDVTSRTRSDVIEEGDDNISAEDFQES